MEKLTQEQKDLLNACYECNNPDVYKITNMIVRDNNIDARFKAAICHDCYYELCGGRWI